MKRDMDLARQILLAIEQNAYQGKSGFSLTSRGDASSAVELDYHIMLLHEAGLIEATETTYLSGKTKWRIERLTWQGHEFLDVARDQSRWHQAKKTISEKGGSLTFDILKGVLAQLARQAVGL